MQQRKQAPETRQQPSLIKEGHSKTITVIRPAVTGDPAILPLTVSQTSSARVKVHRGSGFASFVRLWTDNPDNPDIH